MLIDALRNATQAVKELKAAAERDTRDADAAVAALVAQVRRGQAHELLTELKRRL